MFHQCKPCNGCKRNKDAIDGKCPDHCVPPDGSFCSDHFHCDNATQFCMKNHKDPTRAHRCTPCQFCNKPHHQSITGECPKHCIPSAGSACDSHHTCVGADAAGGGNAAAAAEVMPEFCALLSLPGFPRRSCVPCHFCTEDS
jgi:hypothetical protein